MAPPPRQVPITGASPCILAKMRAQMLGTAVSGTSIEAIIIYKEGASDAASPLLAFIDTATGLPITPNTGDIIVNWDNGANKIFKL